jgi:polysaccharide transporter, PST family
MANKRIIDNLISMSFLQAANYALPLVTLPYLTRVIGIERFGLIAFAQAVIHHLEVLTDYGFNLSATREVSIAKNEISKVCEIFSSVMAVKCLLMAVSFVLLTLAILFVPGLRSEWLLYYLTFGIVVGQVFFPVWLYLGMERMRYIAVLSVLAKVFSTILIFAFVRKPDDYLLVALFSSSGYVLSAVAAMWLAISTFKIRWRRPSIDIIKQQVLRGRHIFIANGGINIYTNNNIVILGLLAPPAVVGAYAAAEKVLRAVTRIPEPLAQSLFPHISHLASSSTKDAMAFMRKAFFGFAAIGLGSSLAIYLLSDEISRLVCGSGFPGSASVMSAMALLPFCVAMSKLFLVQGLYGFGLPHQATRVIVPMVVLHAVIIAIAASRWGAIGTAYGYVTVESMVALMAAIAFVRYVPGSLARAGAGLQNSETGGM